MTDIQAFITELKKHLRYDAVTGKFFNINAGIRSGTEAGSRRKDGYIVITFKQKKYLAHRLAWLLEKGEWPGPHLDHDNHDTSLNVMSNLKDRGVSGNALNRKGANINSSSKIRGVYPRSSGRYMVMVAGKYFGTFPTMAIAERVAKANQNV